MPEYIQQGSWADAGIAILVGLFLGLAVASLTNSHRPASTHSAGETTTVKSQTVEAPKPIVKVHSTPSPQPKNDCNFWRTMYFANAGKSMGAYYMVQWQNCEATK